MRRFSKAMGLSVAALVLAVTMGQTAPAGRSGAAPAPGPLRLAVVNVGKLMQSLDEDADNDRAFDKMKADVSAEKATREKKIATLQDSLGGGTNPRPDFKPGSQEYLNTEEALLEETANYDAFMKIKQAVMLNTIRTKKAEIYEKMMRVIADYSNTNGFGLVFATDDQSMFAAQTPQDLMQLITMKKLLYYNPVLDITGPLISKMNADYKLGAATPKN